MELIARVLNRETVTHVLESTDIPWALNTGTGINGP